MLTDHAESVPSHTNVARLTISSLCAEYLAKGSAKRWHVRRNALAELKLPGSSELFLKNILNRCAANFRRVFLSYIRRDLFNLFIYCIPRIIAQIILMSLRTLKDSTK